jgi:hypothetical protein
MEAAWLPDAIVLPLPRGRASRDWLCLKERRRCMALLHRERKAGAQNSQSANTAEGRAVISLCGDQASLETAPGANEPHCRVKA